MNPVTSFDSTKNQITELLGDIHSGKLQLPDFQRGWVWDDDHIQGLLASVSLSYPIGALMLLETGNPGVRFKPRLVEGVPTSVKRDPEHLILDGQQRLTSLYLSLWVKHPVQTQDSRKVPVRRWCQRRSDFDPTIAGRDLTPPALRSSDPSRLPRVLCLLACSFHLGC